MLNRKFVRESFAAAMRAQFDSDELGQIKRFEQMKLQEQDELVAKRIGELLGVVDENKIITYDKTGHNVFIGGKLIDERRSLNLRSEAEFILQSDLGAILFETPRKIAEEVMFNKSQNFDDMRNGKSILYTVSLQNKILEIFKMYTPKVVQQKK